MDKLRPAVSKTKGWIYKETDEYIITFGTYSTDINDNIIEFGEVLCIPKIGFEPSPTVYLRGRTVCCRLGHTIKELKRHRAYTT